MMEDVTQVVLQVLITLQLMSHLNAHLVALVAKPVLRRNNVQLVIQHKDIS